MMSSAKAMKTNTKKSFNCLSLLVLFDHLDLLVPIKIK